MAADDERTSGTIQQDDAFGRDGLKGVKQALAKRGLELTAEGTFERNTRAVGAALRVIKRAEPEAVVMVGTYGPCAEFIKLARKLEFNPVFVNISFVGASALAKELGPDGKGVVISQVVLSFGIPFALVPLVLLTRRADIMGALVNRRATTVAAAGIAATIIALNVYLLWSTFYPLFRH